MTLEDPNYEGIPQRSTKRTKIAGYNVSESKLNPLF